MFYNYLYATKAHNKTYKDEVLQMVKRFEHIYRQVELVIASKIEEFHYCGYRAITRQQLWEYCIDKKWYRKNIDELHLHEIVATIYEATASSIMNYEQVKELRYTQAAALMRAGLDLSTVREE